ncbi:MAG: asparagine synthase (glutamine-hydrolyzing) [Candidatus Riflebacteria bacterium]|nr:asparagine synthase (glutamine-hydrolyzing) [Candidatus Riflebacteria bacterium]
MCGITGFIDKSGRVRPELFHPLIEAMTDCLVHRGPDGSGIWIDEAEGIAVGHRRLAVLDLSVAANQPMISPGGQFILVFNGEIYNYRSIRNRLESEGLAPCGGWQTSSDTEVMVVAIECWGLETVLACVTGMFAFVLWDRRERQLILAIDRIGEKPLYYGWLGSVFVFASELKALRPHPGFIPEIDRNSLALFMKFGHVPAPHCIFKKMYKLEPGTFVVIRHNNHQASSSGENGNVMPYIHRYWSLANVVSEAISQPFHGNDCDAANLLEKKLREVIRDQMVADVPLGAMLSGGIDSSTITSIMQSESSRPISTFTIGFSEADYNEAYYAADVARHLGTDHHELIVTPVEARDVIPLLPALYDEPFADSSQIPTFLVARMARKRVAVVLTGDGGDELFGGYYRHIFTHRFWRRLQRVPIRWKHAAASFLQSVIPFVSDGSLVESILAGFFRQSVEKLEKLVKGIESCSLDDFYESLITTGNCDIVKGQKGISGEVAASKKSFMVMPMEPALYMMFRDTVEYLPGDILVKVDRAGMGASLETRMPFLDPGLVSFAWQLPLAMKIRGSIGKYIPRLVLYKYVPRAMVDHPKSGFAVPIDSWLRGPLREWGEEYLSESRLYDEGFLEPEIVRTAWNEHLYDHKNHASFLWNVLMFQTWLASFDAAAIRRFVE